MAYCAMCPPSRVSWFPAGRCGFNRILGICPTHLLSGGSVPTERNVTPKFDTSRKSRDEKPVRVRQAKVRKEKPEASRRATAQAAQRKPKGNRPFSVTSPYLFIGESPSVRRSPAIHPLCRLEKRQRRYASPCSPSQRAQ